LRHDRPRSGKEAAERLKKVARGKREARSPWIARKKLFSPERATECAEGANRSRSAVPAEARFAVARFPPLPRFLPLRYS
jgi:hypothetical protein